MWIGNLMLIIINLPLIGIWVQLLRVPYRLLFPAILVFCCHRRLQRRNSRVRRLADGCCFGLLGYVLHQARRASRRRFCSASCLDR